MTTAQARPLDAGLCEKSEDFQKSINSDRIGISGYKKNRYPAARNL
jgi:hypothetical protein